MIKAVESVRRDVVVPVSAQRAFEVFTADMTSWWPSDHHIGSAPIERIVVEPHEGGRWYTRHTDGSETSTGYVVAWEPAERLVMTWQIGADWKYDPRLVTTVEVRFVEEAADRTRVVLEHRDLDAFGPEAERMRDMFDGPGAWQATLAAFAAGVARTRDGDEVRPALLLRRRRTGQGARALPGAPRPAGRVPRARHAAGGRHLRQPSGRGLDGHLHHPRSRRGVRPRDPFVLGGVVSAWEVREWNEMELGATSS